MSNRFFRVYFLVSALLLCSLTFAHSEPSGIFKCGLYNHTIYGGQFDEIYEMSDGEIVVEGAFHGVNDYYKVSCGIARTQDEAVDIALIKGECHMAEMPVGIVYFSCL